MRQIDVRVFAELYAAVWLLSESASGGATWRSHLRHLCAGRRLHRRRYAARRIVTAAGVRIERARERAAAHQGPSCPMPAALRMEDDGRHADTIARGMATLIGTLSMVWEAPAEQVFDELERERRRAHRTAGDRRAGRPEPVVEAVYQGEKDEFGYEGEGVVSLDGWKRRRRGRRRRYRVDPRGGRGHARGGGRAA